MSILIPTCSIERGTFSAVASTVTRSSSHRVKVCRVSLWRRRQAICTLSLPSASCRIFPPARISFFLLREPADQIHSTFRYFQSNWNWIAPGLSFQEFLVASESGTNRFRGNELAQYALRNAAYVDFLLRWRDACGKDRVHVFLFEEAFSDKRRFMRHLAGQFGIDPDFYDDYDFSPENQTYAVRSKALQKINIAVRSWIPQGAFYKAARSLYRRMNTRIPAAGGRAGTWR